MMQVDVQRSVYVYVYVWSGGIMEYTTTNSYITITFHPVFSIIIIIRRGEDPLESQLLWNSSNAIMYGELLIDS